MENPSQVRSQAEPSHPSTIEMSAQSTLRCRMKDLFLSGDYSDIKIICRSVHFNVHQAIICPQSDFFSAAMTQGWPV